MAGSLQAIWFKRSKGGPIDDRGRVRPSRFSIEMSA